MTPGGGGIPLCGLVLFFALAAKLSGSSQGLLIISLPNSLPRKVCDALSQIPKNAAP